MVWCGVVFTELTFPPRSRSATLRHRECPSSSCDRKARNGLDDVSTLRRNVDGIEGGGGVGGYRGMGNHFFGFFVIQGRGARGGEQKLDFRFSGLMG